MNDKAELIFDHATSSFICTGSWSVANLTGLSAKLATQRPKSEITNLTIDGRGIKYFDSAGALTLIRWVESLRQQVTTVTLQGFSKSHEKILHLIERHTNNLEYTPPAVQREHFFHRIGLETFRKLGQIDGVVILVGGLSLKIFEAISDWRRFHWHSIVSNINSGCIQALPIVALLSFLIGVVLAYQMGLQLKTYGANIFIAYLSGMAIFREFSPLITAIIVAGRTSSAFTAQIGSMKINEEIDALHTMGLSPTELLVAPKMLGLMFVFPLLIFWSDVFSVLGAMFMSKNMLNVGYFDFLSRLRDSVGFKQMALGLYKAPVFALIISLVGCFQGFEVQASADNIGSQTTKSVVQALFLIIIADAAFSVIYSWMGL